MIIILGRLFRRAAPLAHYFSENYHRSATNEESLLEGVLAAPTGDSGEDSTNSFRPIYSASQQLLQEKRRINRIASLGLTDILGPLR